jgi:hypothetical protein
MKSKMHFEIPNLRAKKGVLLGQFSKLQPGEVKVACHRQGRAGRLPSHATKMLEEVTCEHCKASPAFQEASCDG